MAQKQAALDVVRNNLESAELSNYLLEIFSIKANRKSVMESLRDRTEMDIPIEPFEFKSKIDRLNETKEKLNEYNTLINSNFGETGFTIHDILWDVPVLELEVPKELHLIKPNESQAISESLFKKYTADLAYLKDTYYDLFEEDVLFNNPIRKIRKRITDLFEIINIKNEFVGIQRELEKHFDNFENLFNKNKALFDISSKDFKSNKLIKKWVDLDQYSKEKKAHYWELLQIVLNPKSPSKVKKYIKLQDQLTKTKKDAKKLRKKMKSIFDLDNNLYELAEIKSAAKLLVETNFFSFFTVVVYIN